LLVEGYLIGCSEKLCSEK